VLNINIIKSIRLSDIEEGEIVDYQEQP